MQFHGPLWNLYMKVIPPRYTQRAHWQGINASKTCKSTSLSTYLIVLHAGYSFSKEMVEILKYFPQIQGAISITSEPILGLFVLIGMHLSCWIQIWQWKFEFWKFSKKVSKILTCRLLLTSEWRVLNLHCTHLWNHFPPYHFL